MNMIATTTINKLPNVTFSIQKGDVIMISFDDVSLFINVELTKKCLDNIELLGEKLINIAQTNKKVL